MTGEKLRKAQAMLNRGVPRYDAADELNIKYDAFRKAINDGRLEEPGEESTEATTLSERSARDLKAAESIGTACTRLDDRITAALIGNSQLMDNG